MKRQNVKNGDILLKLKIIFHRITIGGKLMDIYKHKSHNVYVLKKNINLMKNNQKIKFFRKGKFISDLQFMIRPHKEWRYFRWFIRLPFFYFERHNSGFCIGTSNLYLWFIKSYRK
jgi:hypothetical protein